MIHLSETIVVNSGHPPLCPVPLHRGPSSSSYLCLCLSARNLRPAAPNHAGLLRASPFLLGWSRDRKQHCSSPRRGREEKPSY